MDFKIDLNEIHREIFESRHRFQVSYGGSGSGKSQCYGYKVLMRLITEHNCRILAIRKFAVNLKDSIYYLLNRLINENELSHLFDITVSPLKIRYKPNGNEVIFRGLDKVDKLKSVENIKIVWMEEADQIDLDDFLELTRRLRGKEKINGEYIDKQFEFWFSLNPTEEESWINQLFFLGEDKYYKANAIKCLSTFRDNKFIDEAYRKSLEALKEIDENQYNVYALGLWGKRTENVYHQFMERDFPTAYSMRFFGLDFGYTNSKTALIEVRIFDNEFYIKEHIYQNELMTKDIADKLREIGINRNEIIFADSARPDSIAELCSYGYNVHKAVKDVVSGISYVKSVYKQTYSDPENYNLKAEIKSYKYIKDKNGKILNDVIKVNDHLLDALRYALYTFNLNYHTTDSNFGFY